jgi:hypothetical protein
MRVDETQKLQKIGMVVFGRSSDPPALLREFVVHP